MEERRTEAELLAAMRELDGPPVPDDELGGNAAGWAEVWPARVGPLGYGVTHGLPAHVCPGCLTEDEREQLEQEQERSRERPF
jgi:hypothetical protein